MPVLPLYASTPNIKNKQKRKKARPLTPYNETSTAIDDIDTEIVSSPPSSSLTTNSSDVQQHPFINQRDIILHRDSENNEVSQKLDLLINQENIKINQKLDLLISIVHSQQKLLNDLTTENEKNQDKQSCVDQSTQTNETMNAIPHIVHSEQSKRQQSFSPTPNTVYPPIPETPMNEPQKANNVSIPYETLLKLVHSATNNMPHPSYQYHQAQFPTPYPPVNERPNDGVSTLHFSDC